MRIFPILAFTHNVAMNILVDFWLHVGACLYEYMPVKEVWYICTTAIRKKELLPSGTAWMDLRIVMLSEISQSEKDKYHKISLVSGIE